MKPIDMRAVLKQMEVDFVKKALDASDGNRAAAARLLGITRPGLVMSLDRLGLKGYKKKEIPIRQKPFEGPLE